MSDPRDTEPVDPTVERRLGEAFRALASAEVPSSAPRPHQAPRPGRPAGRSRRRRFQIAGGSLLAVAAAVVVALVVGTEVNEARTVPTAPPATGHTVLPAPTTSPDPSGRPSTSGAPTSPGATTSGGTAGPGLCTPTVMTFSVTDEHPAGASAYFEVHAVNASSSTCVTTGFPGIALLDATGRQIAQAARRPSVASTTIEVAPGQEVTAQVTSGDPGAGSASCPTSPAFLLTMPDNTDSTRITHATPSCGPAVTAFVAGPGSPEVQAAFAAATGANRSTVVTVPGGFEGADLSGTTIRLWTSADGRTWQQSGTSSFPPTVLPGQPVSVKTAGLPTGADHAVFVVDDQYATGDSTGVDVAYTDGADGFGAVKGGSDGDLHPSGSGVAALGDIGASFREELTGGLLVTVDCSSGVPGLSQCGDPQYEVTKYWQWQDTRFALDHRTGPAS